MFVEDGIMFVKESINGTVLEPEDLIREFDFQTFFVERVIISVAVDGIV
jgi:hypothetical protein